MDWVALITIALQFVMELFKNYKLTPEQAKLAAIASITQEMEDDLHTFNKALADNDGNVIAAQFESLRLRALKATGGNTGQSSVDPGTKP